MSEQEKTSPALVQHAVASVRPSWRTEPDIDAERQQFLAEHLAVEPDIRQSIYPFKDVRLTRADVEWLLANHEQGRGPIDWSDLQQRERVGLDLRGANLRQVDLRHLPLTRLVGGLTREEWLRTTLDQRDLAGVHLERADLSRAHLEGTTLEGAHMDGATLRGTFMQRTNLFRADLRNTYLREVHFEQASLRGIRLEGAYLLGAYLQGADLRNASFDSSTNLEGITLSDRQVGPASLADVSWGSVNLAVADWSRLTRLGDEHRAQELRTGQGIVKNKVKRLDDYRAAVRASRQLANAMRAQGMNEEAISFAYRAQVLQRKVLWRQVLWGQAEPFQTRTLRRGWRQQALTQWRRFRKLVALIFSYFLDVIAGYGYRPGRTLFIYLVVIAVFALCYYAIGHLPPTEALIFSTTSFHGRGFLPGPFSLGSPVTGLAAIEAVMGLFIEISFIATFTQRFFGR